MATPAIPAGFEPFTDPEPTTPPIPAGFEPVPAQQPPAQAPRPISELTDSMAMYANTQPAGQYGLTQSARDRGVRFSVSQSASSQNEQIGSVLKYGPSLVAGALTGGSSVPVQMAATGLAGAVGSLAEQATGPNPISGTEVAASGLESAIPIFKFAPITPFMSTAKQVGLGAARAGATAATAGALTEGASALRPDYVPPKTATEAMTRLLNPAAAVAGGFSMLGSVAERAAARGAQGTKIRTERGATTQTTQATPTQTVMLTDILPQYAPLEARSIIARNPRAMDALRDLTVDIDQSILQQFADAPNASKIASDIAPAVGKLKGLQENARAAQATADQAQAAYQQSISTGRSDIRDMAIKANALAMNARSEYELMNKGVDQFIGQQKPSLAALSPVQNTERLQGLLESTFKVQSDALGSLYQQAGIGANDAVINKAGIVSAINRRARDSKTMLHGNEARRAALDQVDQLFSGADTLTLEQFRNARNAIATGLEDNRLFASSAGKLAGEAYSAIREASDDFISKNMPDRAPAWANANKAAAEWYKARDSDFIRDFVDPSTGVLRQGKAGEFVNALTQGKVEGFTDLAKLADAIQGTGEPAAQAASESFRKGVAQYIATGVLDSAAVNRATGLSSDAAVFDPRKLYTTLNKLQSQKFPVDSLGMGTAKDINALARISQGTSITRPELEEFFKNVSSLGGDVAAARLAYRRNVVENLLDLGSGNAVDKIRKTQSLARRARIDAATAQRELTAAQNDPLVKAFGEGTFGLSSDPTIPGREGWVASIRTLYPEQAKRLVDALPAATKQDFRSRTAADILAQYTGVTPGVTPNAPVKSIRDFFFSPSNEAERKTVRAIMGPEYAKMQEVATKLEPVLKTQYLLKQGAERSRLNMTEQAGGIGALAGLATGQSTTGFVLGRQIGAIRKLADQGQYNLLYTLYVNPNFAPKFARASNNLEKFANESGLHRVAIQAAMKQDEERKQAQQTQ